MPAEHQVKAELLSKPGEHAPDNFSPHHTPLIARKRKGFFLYFLPNNKGMSVMKFLPIEKDPLLNEPFLAVAECAEVLGIFTQHYQKAGFHKPWIAYFIANEQDEIIGGGGFKGAPKDGEVEISYGTFEKHQGKGIGSEICRQLILLALQSNPAVSVVARTLPDNAASIKILEKNGFVCSGRVQDEEDGEVLQWTCATAHRAQP